ncbi:flagellar biosynthetic protein FliO [Tissierella carlieri]|jgi:flagellar biogenesis protein FliO|uniref:flagellar biosynthetic protein FliO n=1 Tax=Tissierella TaxID=41273 RepID=UPI002804629F|nr:flagellar biosynthetic protein FliO [uncultured Tissierella sp.]MDU5079891.1 hypothetical protein [Bacillota bacterium]
MSKIKRINLLFIFIFVTLYGLPAYAAGYEEISPTKIIFQLIFYIVIFILVIFLTLYGTKLIAKNFKGITSSKYISLLDVINIPGGVKIIIAKINDKIYILSVADNNTNVIDTIEADNFPTHEENFDNYLSKYLHGNNNDNKINKKLENLFDKFNIKKDKEDRNDEKKY